MLALTITRSSFAVSRDADYLLETQDDLSVLAGIDVSARADFERRFDWVKLVERLAWQGLLHADVETLSTPATARTAASASRVICSFAF